MNEHADVVDLLPGYALGAASAEEAGSIRSHLPECGECRADLVRLSEAASVLALAVEEVAPPPRLRERITAAVRAEVAPITDAGKAPPAFRWPRTSGIDRAAKDRRGADRLARRQGVMSRLRAPWIPAAAAAVIMAGLLAWNVRLQSELSSRPTAVAGAGVVAVPLRGARGADFGVVTFLSQQKLAMVGLRNLASPAAGRAYELWVIAPKGTPKPAGVFLPDNDGTKLLVVPQDIRGDTLAVTEEPFGGSALPTTTPFVTGSA